MPKMMLRKLQIEMDDTAEQSPGYLEALSQIDENGKFTSKLIHSQKNQAFDLILTKAEIEKLSSSSDEQSTDDKYSKIHYDHSKFGENLVNMFLSENSKTENSWFSIQSSISNDNNKLIWKKKSKLAQSGMKTFAELTIQATDIMKAREEMLNEILKIQSKSIHFENEYNKLKSERDENLKRMEQMVEDKNALEDRLYR